jgi:LPXTG-motif cell wall-anchored protein
MAKSPRTIISVLISAALIFAATPAFAVTNVTSPSSTISGANTGLATPADVAYDSAGGIYVANSAWSGGTASVAYFASGAQGDVAPTRIVTGNLTTLSHPAGVAVDENYLYVSDFGVTSRLLVFSITATGNVAPLNTFPLSRSPFGLSLNSQTGDLAVGARAGIYIFPNVADLTGTIIDITSNSIGSSDFIYDLAWDSANGLYVANDNGGLDYFASSDLQSTGLKSPSSSNISVGVNSSAVAIQPNSGDVFFAKYSPGSITGISGGISSPTTVFSISSSQGFGPNGIEFRDCTTLAVANYNENTLDFFDLGLTCVQPNSSVNNVAPQLAQTGTSELLNFPLAFGAFLAGLVLLVLRRFNNV